MTERQPVFGKCEPCGHIWTVMYAPMAFDAAARCMRRATCPSCGNIRRVTLAKQDNGKLLEDVPQVGGGT